MFSDGIPMEAPFENPILRKRNFPRAENMIFPYGPSGSSKYHQNPPFLTCTHRFSALANLVPPLIFVILTPLPPNLVILAFFGNFGVF